MGRRNYFFNFLIFYVDFHCKAETRFCSVLMFILFCLSPTQDKKDEVIDPEAEESKVKSLLLLYFLRTQIIHVNINQSFKRTEILMTISLIFLIQIEDEHHFRKPANDITSQLEINFGDLGRPGRGGPRGGRGGRGRGGGRGGGGRGDGAPGAGRDEATRPVRGGRTEKVDNLLGSLAVCH